MTSAAARESEARTTTGRDADAAAEAGQIRLVGSSDLRIWDRQPAERLMRAFAKAARVPVLDHPAVPAQETGRVVLVRADAVLDAPVVDALLSAKDVVLLGNENSDGEPLAMVVPAAGAAEAATWLERGEPGAPPQGVDPVRPQDLCSSHWSKLRKREVPYAMRATAERAPAIEWRVYMGTYKGVTDAITRYVWPVPAFWGTKLCVRLGIHPNVVTLCSLALVVLAYLLFQGGHFAAGLAAGWLMALLDTVDGKLARVTMTSSRFGNVLDHGIDLIHPPFWYAAWRFGLGSAALSPSTLDWALGVTVVGYVLLRIMEGVFKWRHGMHIHVWRRVDTWFRLIVSRRNPNLVLLTAGTLLGRPDLGLLAVAVWTAISVVVHLVQLAQAEHGARGGRSLRSWLAAEPAA